MSDTFEIAKTKITEAGFLIRSAEAFPEGGDTWSIELDRNPAARIVWTGDKNELSVERASLGDPSKIHSWSQEWKATGNIDVILPTGITKLTEIV